MYRKLFLCIFISSSVCATVVAAAAEVLIGGTSGPAALAILLVWASVIVLCALTAAQLAERFSKSVSKASGSDSPERKYPELGPLAERIRRQNRLIGKQMGELRHRQDEFMSIISVMQEGFILADAEGMLLSCNSSALKLLGADDAIGDGRVTELCRDPEFSKLVRRGLLGERVEGVLAVGGRFCQVMVNPEMLDGKLEGIGVVILDVTEREQRDALRREFTSNVSHELKTPLTTIRGTAELLASGMVRPEDEQGFLKSICGETERLIALIEDILRLSRLDEGRLNEEKTETDLFSLSKAVAERISQTAKDAKVRLRVEGESAVVNGVPLILDEMIFNLVDNGIKYNRPGGSVAVTVKNEKDGVLLDVSDTGIGIPQEHLGRIFERFYRVDKSRSKSLGGTGLGLSIVKHAAGCHGAELSIKSRVGCGTSVSVFFKK